MAMVYCLRLDCGGLVSPRIDTIYPKLPSHSFCQRWRRFKNHNGMQGPFRRVLGYPNPKVQHILGKKYTLPMVGNRQHLTMDDCDQEEESFWSNFMKSMKPFIGFLVEQPNQLKHIEWPSVQSTLKTAILSLILVGLLIVALASVDSVLCYVLSLIQRRRA